MSLHHFNCAFNLFLFTCMFFIVSLFYHLSSLLSVTAHIPLALLWRVIYSFVFFWANCKAPQQAWRRRVGPLLHLSTAASSTAAWGQWPAAQRSSSNREWQPMGSREAQTSDGKGRSSRRLCNTVKTLTFRERSLKSLEGAMRVQRIKGVFPCRDGRMQPQRTTWNTCVSTVQLPPLCKCPNGYSCWRWSEVKVDHLCVRCQNACRYKVHLSANKRQENIQDHLTHWPKEETEHFKSIWHTLVFMTNVNSTFHILQYRCGVKTEQTNIQNKRMCLLLLSWYLFDVQ